MQNCVKRAGNSLTWCSQPQAVVQSNVQACPHMPDHCGGSPRVVVVAQEVDVHAVLPGDGTQASLAPELVPATLGQPRAKFLVVVLAASHDGAPYHDYQFVPAGGRARQRRRNDP